MTGSPAQSPAPDPDIGQVPMQRALGAEAAAVALLLLPQNQRAWTASQEHQHNDNNGSRQWATPSWGGGLFPHQPLAAPLQRMCASAV